MTDRYVAFPVCDTFVRVIDGKPDPLGVQRRYTNIKLTGEEYDLLPKNEAGWRARLFTPIPMILHCPKCGHQHVDAPEPLMCPSAYESVTNVFDPCGPGLENHCAGCGGDKEEHISNWLNPPHRSHKCKCGCIWRPADVPTVGVAAIQTKGKADNWPNDTTSPSPTPQTESSDASESRIDSGPLGGSHV